MTNKTISRDRTLTCVVIDDDADWIDHVRELLVRAFPAAVIVPFSEPASALAHLRMGASDVVITALHLPGMKGCTFIEELREFNHTTPTIMMTCDVAARDEAFGCGADDFIPKYALRAQLTEAVLRLVATDAALATVAAA